MAVVNPPLPFTGQARALFPAWTRRMQAKWVLAKRHVSHRQGPRVPIGTHFESAVFIQPAVQR